MSEISMRYKIMDIYYIQTENVQLCHIHCTVQYSSLRGVIFGQRGKTDSLLARRASQVQYCFLYIIF